MVLAAFLSRVERRPPESMIFSIWWRCTHGRFWKDDQASPLMAP